MYNLYCKFKHKINKKLIYNLTLLLTLVELNSNKLIEKDKILKLILDFLKRRPNSKLIDIVDGLKNVVGQELNRTGYKKILWENAKLFNRLEYNGTYRIKEKEIFDEELYLQNNLNPKDGSLDQNLIDFDLIKKIIIEEKYRLGRPDSNLLAENILFRLNELRNYEFNKTD
jgi:hypothetical protein